MNNYYLIYEKIKKTKIIRINNKIENAITQIIKYIFLLLFVLFQIYYNKKLNENDIESKISKQLGKKGAIYYMNICLKDLLINSDTSLNVNNYPRISVIIPVYNCEKFIKYSIRSVQNQNMKDFEIILINDNSTDGSLNIIQSLQKKDKRIKILNNKKNMGTLYSRSVGALNAKGEFIFPLDNDDLFFNEDLFESIYNIAKNQKFDIVEFKAFDIPDYINFIQLK